MWECNRREKRTATQVKDRGKRASEEKKKKERTNAGGGTAAVDWEALKEEQSDFD